MRKVLKHGRLGTGISYLYLSILSIVAVFPLLWIFISSLKTAEELTSSNSFFPKEITFENYLNVVNYLHLDINIKNSIIITVIATIIAVFISALGAYGIVRYFPRFGALMTKIMITMYMLPPILLAIPYLIIMSNLNLANTFTGLIIVFLSFSVPFAIWLLVGFFQTVPLEVEEAATIDGANRFKVFYQIALPIAAPGIVATALFTFINTWNEFLFSLILINSQEKMPVSVALYSLKGSETFEWGAMMAASFLVVIPTIIFFMLIQKKIAGGLAQGSIK